MTLERKRRALLAVTAALATLVVAVQYQPKVADALDPEAATVSGVVFVDANGNGRQDERERGLGDVQVSDGVQIVRTDAEGRYSFELDTARRITDIVSITQPAGYVVPTDEYMTPRFYRTLGQLADGVSATADFAVERDNKSRRDAFNFANVADPHVNPDMAGQIAQINASSQDLAFIQVSGDLTNNATDAEFSTTATPPRPPSSRSGPRSATTSTLAAGSRPTPGGSTTTAATWVPSGTRSTTATATSWSSTTAAARRSRSRRRGSSATSRPTRPASAWSCSCISR
jgi:hypothetical protein